MPNSNYVKGRKKEYDMVHKFKDAGCAIAFRSAGSHSPIDVVGIDVLLRKIYLIQCKPENFSLRKRSEIEGKWQWLSGNFEVIFKII